MSFAFTYVLPTIVGTVSNLPVVLKTVDFPVEAIDGGSSSLLDGGGNLRAYTSDTKAVRLSLDIVALSVGGSPDVQVFIGMPVVVTGGTIYLEADDIETAQPAVGVAFGRDSVWSDYDGVYHCEIAATGLADSSGNGNDTTGGTTVISGVLGDQVSFSTSQDQQFKSGYNSAIASNSTFSLITTRKGSNNVFIFDAPATSNRLSLVYWDNKYQWYNDTFIGSGIDKAFGVPIFIDLVCDGVNTKFYADGVLIETMPDQSSIISSITSLTLGDVVTNNIGYMGDIDEFNISTQARSADFITAKYSNQSSVAAWGVVGDWVENFPVTGTDVYTFLDTNADLLTIAVPYTGSIDIIISGTSTTGINPDLLGSPFINSPASMLTDPDDAIRNTLTASVTNLAFLVDATFNGIVYAYSKDGIFYHVDMGPIGEPPINSWNIINSWPA